MHPLPQHRSTLPKIHPQKADLANAVKIGNTILHLIENLNTQRLQRSHRLNDRHYRRFAVVALHQSIICLPITAILPTGIFRKGYQRRNQVDPQGQALKVVGNANR